MRTGSGLMYPILIISKLVLYSIVFYRLYSRTDLNGLLLLLTAAVIACDLMRSARMYSNPRINLVSLYLSIGLAAAFYAFTAQIAYEKLFLIYLLEGIAVLPVHQAVVYVLASLLAFSGIAVHDMLREYGRLVAPPLAEAALLPFMMALVIGERLQREQRMAFEKLNNTLKFVNQQLQESNTWNEALSIEAERRRLAAELHDSLGHELTGLIISLEAGRKLQDVDTARSSASWDQALRTARQAMQSVRELVSSSRADSSDFILPDRLEQMVRNVASLSGLEIDSSCDPGVAALPPPIQFHLYRIFQEALTNTLRHATATRAAICIGCSQGAVDFIYQDNGAGADRIVEGSGLQGIRERVEAMRGQVAFSTSPGKGFAITGIIGGH